ncbi:hypothetical protein [Lentzea flava]|uniref:Uncharacterized protein n=1 Tax=Lentzea flava TaxID=103732 RepID=A0ABQ2UNJ8_9PSEU|nr:hypothetical protein [Lentzea flava]MCP2200052.1 hypothetical protein [Lentzea flava]GGU45823.1 hypothetical protein GCM10010178_42880 [Lentzea flava]
MGAQWARISLPTSAGGWLLGINEDGVCIEVDGWNAYTSGAAEPPKEGLFVGHRGFKIPLVEVPKFLIALNAASSLGFARSENREEGIWKVEQVRDQVFVHGPLRESTATDGMVRAGTLLLPWLGLCELGTLLAALLPQV